MRRERFQIVGKWTRRAKSWQKELNGLVSHVEQKVSKKLSGGDIVFDRKTSEFFVVHTIAGCRSGKIQKRYYLNDEGFIHALGFIEL